MAKILNFGSLNVDYVYNVDHFVLPGETISSTSRLVNAGGKGLNQSIALSLSGSNVFHAGRIGSDGTLLADVLKSKCVDTTYVKSGEGASGHAIIQVDKSGQNSIILFPGENCEISESQIDETLLDFGQGDYLVLQNEISNISLIIEKAFRKGMKIVLNPSPIKENLKDFPLELISLFVVNEIEAECLSGEKEPSKQIKKFSELYPDASILLTLGSKGAVYFDGKKTIKYGIHKANVVDTTAAGDTMLGYFVSLLAKGESPEKALEVATKASSITVSRKGAGNSIPTIDEALNCGFPYIEFKE